MTGETDKTLLLDLLNSTPLIDGVSHDALADAEAGRRWLGTHGQPDSELEWRVLLEVCSALRGVVRGDLLPATVARFVEGVNYRPSLVDKGIRWNLGLPVGRSAAARAVLAWDCARARTRTVSCSCSTTASPTAPGGARWQSAGTG